MQGEEVKRKVEMEEGGLALSFPRESFFHFHECGNLAAHDFLKVGCALAGELDFFGDLSGGRIVMIRCQGGLFFCSPKMSYRDWETYGVS